VPDFPLDVVPPDWRRWIRESAEAAGAPIDYVAQGLLAAVAAAVGYGNMASSGCENAAERGD
jgi:F0F1-type ATP synthase membrane subunit c/vacuolar-type H+-ATPase subunit K